VRVLHALARLTHVLHRLRHRQWPPLPEVLRQIDAAQQLHRQEVGAAGLAGVEDLNDVRVRQQRRRPHLTEETLDGSGRIEPLRGP